MIKKGVCNVEKINQYINALYNKQDPLLEDVLTSIRENDMPLISVSPSAGKLLTLLVKMSGAKNVLEIGALGGYSGIHLARGMGEGGTLTSLELKESYAQLAKRNLEKAGFGEQVTYMTGPALDSLEQLAKEKKRFDFFFIDADKNNYENYLNYCVELAEPNAVITMDNVLARGSVANEEMEPRRYTKQMKALNEIVASHPKLDSVIVPIGDGITVAIVLP